MIPIGLFEPSLRIVNTTKESNELAQRAELGLIEVDKKKAIAKEEAIKHQMARKYNKKVNPQEFEEGDLVLRKVELQRKP